MKLSIIYLSILFVIFTACTSKTEKTETSTTKPPFALPSTWSKDFRIYTSAGGGMNGEYVTVEFTRDSCIYTTKTRDSKEINSIALTEAKRTEILERLQGFKADKIRILPTDTTLDGESTMICFYNPEEFCLIDGSTTEIHKDDIAAFSMTYMYLTGIAKPKTVQD